MNKINFWGCGIKLLTQKRTGIQSKLKRKKKKMIKSKILLYLMIIITIILCIPSILYLIENKTVDGFDAYYTYTLKPWDNLKTGLINGIIVISLLVIMSTLYILIIKKQNEIFNSRKQILIFIIIISFLFMLILPYLSDDIYYYIGDSWISAEYNENPYYTSVQDLKNKGINDEILRNTGYWSATTTIYGPVWNGIAKFLVSLSFGSLTAALFIFKIASYLIHILNCYIIYKLTKSNKYILLYGLNPLVLMEFLSNVHNDIYLILFILLALYYMIRKKNIVLTIIFLALSICIKYSTILLVPFILIYLFKDKSIGKRILYSFISGLSIVALVVVLYVPYYRDFTIFTNMLIQGDKYNQSLMLFLLLNIDENIFLKIRSLSIPIFVIIYIITILTVIFKKKILFRDLIRKYNVLMLIFIFLILTTFQKWYILWLLPTIIWQNNMMRKYIIYLTVIAIIPSINYFVSGIETYKNGNLYSVNVFTIGITVLMFNILVKYIKKIVKRRNKCQI